MSKKEQTKIEMELLKLLFSSNEFQTEEYFQENYLKKYEGKLEKSTIKEYIRVTYENLIDLELLKDGKLNEKYSLVHYIDDINPLIEICFKSIQRYRKFKTLVNEKVKYLDDMDSETDTNLSNSTKEEREFTKEVRKIIEEKEGFDKSKKLVAGIVHELIIKFTTDFDGTESGSYVIGSDFLKLEKVSMRRYYFKKILYKILYENLSEITDEKITTICSSSYTSEDSLKEMKSMICKAFVALGIFIGKRKAINVQISEEKHKKYIEEEKKSNKKIEKNKTKVYKHNWKTPDVWEIVQFDDYEEEWRINAISKIESISEILKSISKTLKVSPEEKDAALKIFNYNTKSKLVKNENKKVIDAN